MSGHSAENDVHAVEAAIRDTGLLGCGCCVDSDDYPADGCPTDPDGPWVDHTYEGECVHEVGRAGLIARAVVKALATTVIPPASTASDTEAS